METTKRMFTADEFSRMDAAGIFPPDTRVELIEGEIIEMSPAGTRYTACVNRITRRFAVAFAESGLVSVQNAVLLSNWSMPLPDLILAKPRPDDYFNQRLSAEDTFLVVEVSDTSIAYDRKIKVPLFAKAGIPEVWIEDLQKNRLLVYRNPEGQTYSTNLALSPKDSVSLIAFPDTVFSVSDLLLSDFV